MAQATLPSGSRDLPPADIGYWALPDARGRGIAARPARRATRCGHEWLGIERIALEHSVRNTASWAVARSVGYEPEGVSAVVHLFEDRRRDSHFHSHLRTVR